MFLCERVHGVDVGILEEGDLRGGFGGVGEAVGGEGEVGGCFCMASFFGGDYRD